MITTEPYLSPWLARSTAFVWGCLWGSFVNVVVHRVPRGMSVARPPSHCPACGAPVKPYDNVPVLSWLLLRGRARCCGAHISVRYPIVEALGGLIAVAVADLVLRSATYDDSLAHLASLFLGDFALAMALMAAAFIDAEHMYVPDAITLTATAFGVATAGLRDGTWTGAAIGAASGFLCVWLPFVLLYRLIRGRHGMGLGDAKLVMVAGAWFEWPGAAFALFGGALQASIAAMVLLAVRGRIDEPEAVRADREALTIAAEKGDEEAKKALEEDPLGRPPGEGIFAARMPFGPFLCLATVEWMLLGDRIRELLPWLGG